MNYKLIYSISCKFYVLLFLAFFSCSRHTDVKEIIAQADNIVEQQPDSALKLLNTVLFPEDLDKATRNKYYLLLLQARDKSDQDITSDTVIFDVKKYFIQQKDYPNAALAAYYCGRVLYEQEVSEAAVEAYLEAMEWAGHTDKDNLKGLIQGNLGTIYRKHFLFEQAIAMCKNAVGWYDKANNDKNKISALMIIGNCFLLDEKIDSAFCYYDKSLKLADEKQIPHLQSNVRQSMGVAYREIKNYEQAKKLFYEAFSFQTDSIEQARLLLNVVQIYVQEDKIDSAKFYFDQVQSLSVNDPRLIRTSFRLMSKLEEKNQRYQEALEYHQEYYRYTTIVFDSEKNNKLLEIQEKYDFEKLKNERIQSKINHQRTIIVFSGILLLLGVFFIFYYIRSLQNKKLLLETEQKISDLRKIAEKSSTKEKSVQNILLQHFNILKKVALIEREITDTEREKGRLLLKKFNKIVYEQDTLDWNKLHQTMNNLQDGLYEKVRETYPELTEVEFRILCLTCEKMNDASIAILLNTSVKVIRNTRTVIRKKLEFPEYDRDFLAHLKEKISETQLIR